VQTVGKGHLTSLTYQRAGLRCFDSPRHSHTHTPATRCASPLRTPCALERTTVAIERRQHDHALAKHRLGLSMTELP
jgi:hypothetical protein